MSDVFVPDWTKPDDLPAGFNDLPEDERGRIMAERHRLLHIYGQFIWHHEARIIGNRNALRVLRDALDAALAAGKSETHAMVVDGEGYAIEIELDDRPWASPSWGSRELPYIDPMAAGKPDPHHQIIRLSAALVKRGVAPVPEPEI